MNIMYIIIIVLYVTQLKNISTLIICAAVHGILIINSIYIISSIIRTLTTDQHHSVLIK